MLFNITGTPEAGETIPGVSAPFATPSYQVSASDLAIIMAAIGANPQSLGVHPNNAVTLATPVGIMNAIAAKIVSDIVKVATSYQNQQAAQAAVATVKPVTIAAQVS